MRKNSTALSDVPSILRPNNDWRSHENFSIIGLHTVDMVVVVTSRIYGVPGVDMLGLIPKELQTWIGFATGINPQSKHAEAARALTKFLSTPPADAVLKPIGIEPFVE